MSAAVAPRSETGLAGGRRFPAQLLLGAVLGGAVLVVALAGAALTSHAPLEGDLALRLRPAGTPDHWLGTDQLGRDLWARVVAGLPWSLGIASVSTAIALVVGGVTGLAAAWRPGAVRNVVNRSVDTLIAFPGLVIAICVIAVIGRGFWPLSLTLGLLTWPFFTRVVYAEARGLIARDYVLAARLFGVRGGPILLRHVLPGLRPTLLVMFAFHFADMLIAESALSFLGLGAPISAPTWGNMLAESRQYLAAAPWMMLAPGSAIVIVVVTLNLVGDGVSRASRERARAVE